MAAYHDYRKLLESKDVDAVVIATNQHWHALPTIDACRAGKDVYLEKPLGNSIGEGPFVIDAWRKYGRIVQVGTQQRSQEHYQQAVELIRAGRLGEISEVRVWDYENYWPGPGSPADTAPPPELDWNLYVGPSPFRQQSRTCITTTATTGSRLPEPVTRSPGAYTTLTSCSGRWAWTRLRPCLPTGGNYAYQTNHDYPNTFHSSMQFAPGPVAKRGFTLDYTMRTGGRRETRSHSKCFIGTKASMVLDRAGYSIRERAAQGYADHSHGSVDWRRGNGGR